MIGSFLTRGLVMVLGYAYPAYECYKTVEKNKPEIEQLLFWCQYWILVAFLTVCERVGDAFISWIPMYGEVKLLFFIYLWHPKMKGTSYVYDSFFKPYLSKHENEIDRNLMELRARAGDMAVLYWQRAASYGQTRIFDILQYVAAQSTPRPRPAQPPQQGGRGRQPAMAPPPPPEEPPSPTSSTSSSQYQKEIAEELASSEPPKVTTQAIPSSSTQNQVSGPNPNPKTQPGSGPGTRPPQLASVAANYQSATAASIAKNQAMAVASSALKVLVSEKSTQSAPAELETIEAETVVVSASEIENGGGGPTDTVMEDAIRMTRGRLRKTRTTTNSK